MKKIKIFIYSDEDYPIYFVEKWKPKERPELERLGYINEVSEEFYKKYLLCERAYRTMQRKLKKIDRGA